MATFTVTETKTYSQTSGEISNYSCGYDGTAKSRVIRFKFTTDSVGASSIHWKLSKFYPWDWQQGIYGSTQIPLNFYIGTDPESHIPSGNDPFISTTITDSVTTYLSPNWINEECYLEGEADVNLMPNTTYYLWIFPGQAQNYIWVSYYASQADINASMVITSSGAGGGMVYIKTSEGWKTAIPYIAIGGEWKQVIPYIAKSGDWKICT